MAGCSVDSLRRYRRDFERIVGPHADKFIDACFVKGIISDTDHDLVHNCTDTATQSTRLFDVIHASVKRKAENYEVLLQLIRDAELPKKSSKELLSKLSAPGEKDTSSSAPASPHELANGSGSETPRWPGQGPNAENGDSWHFFWPSDAEPRQEPEAINRTSDGFAEGFEESILPTQDTSQPGLLHQEVLPAIREVVMCLQTSRQECRQKEAEIEDLSKQLQSLKNKHSQAHEEIEKLQLKNRRQFENMEDLRRKLSKQQCDNHETVESNERLRVRVADVEKDRHDVKIRYEQEMAELQAANGRLQNRLDVLCNEEFRLRHLIVKKDRKMEKITFSYRFCKCFCFVSKCIAVLFIFLLLLFIFLRL